MEHVDADLDMFDTCDVSAVLISSWVQFGNVISI